MGTKMPSNNQRVAVITGGARGIGLGIAEKLADENYALVLVGRRPAEDVTDTVQALEQRGAKVLYHVCDISNTDDHAALVEATLETFGGIDVLINNAGVAPNKRADILEADPESFDRLMAINLKGPYFLTQSVANAMVAQRPQRGEKYQPVIIIVGSISATVASVSRGDYCISKAGIAMATALWAARLGEHGIGVFEVRPGITKTDMTSGVSEKYDKLIAEGLTAVPRWGLPADVGTVVADLARGGWLYATGSVIMVDGGLTIPRL